MNFSNGTVGLNYHRWSVCEPARQCGKRLGIPVYKALREPIIRRFGEEFYKALETAEQLLRINKKQRHEMKNRHIIAAALLLLTTTAAAQDRHTERPRTPVKTCKRHRMPNSSANRSKRCNGSSTDLLEGRDTTARKNPRCFPIPWNPSPT